MVNALTRVGNQLVPHRTTWGRPGSLALRPRRPLTVLDFLEHLVCAKCNKQVDEAEKVENPLCMEIRYSVRCHGDVESVVVTEAMLQSGKIMLGRAFETKTLPPGEKGLAKR